VGVGRVHESVYVLVDELLEAGDLAEDTYVDVAECTVVGL
jgi:hypothetical protein